MRILLTGSASHLARATLPILLEHDAINHVIGVDIRDARLQHEKFEQHLMDIRSPAISDVFNDIDCVIHMAFVVMRGELGRQRHNRALMYDINVNGSINVFTQAARHRVPSLIHMSSAAVYGPHKDTPDCISERQPLRALPRFAYAEDKVAVEHWLEQWLARTSMRVVRLRPHAILGQHSQPLLKRILHFPVIPHSKDDQTSLQCVWENDVACAIIQAIFSDVSGSFNLSTRESLSFQAMHQLLNPSAITLPYSLLRHTHRLTWYITGRYGEPGWMQALQYPLTLNINKAACVLDWQPSRSLNQCLDMIRS